MSGLPAEGGVTACRICGSGDLAAVPFGYRYHDRWIGALRCRACGIIFLDPQPGPAEIAAMYSHEYFEGGDFRCGHAGSYFDREGLAGLVDTELLGRIRGVKPSGAFLEVGCAGGAFLDAARKEGYRVQGVEYSHEMAAFARTTFNLDVQEGDLLDAHFPDASFDVVFMGDVLEHLPNPVQSLTEVRRILRPGGILVVLCPLQTNTLFSRLGFVLYGALGKRAEVHLPPYHLFEYRKGSMDQLMRRCGLRTIRSTESVMPPSEIALRGPALQRLFKKAFHYPNYAVTRVAGLFGDRIEVFAQKESAG